jgi:IPT/TIG domain
LKKPVVLGFAAIVAVVTALLPAAAGAKTGTPSVHPVVLQVSSLKPGRAGKLHLPGYLPLHKDAYAAAKAAANKRAGIPQLGSNATAGQVAATVSTYPNVAPSFDGIFDTAGTPPDTTGAIGPDRYIETVNTDYAIFNRNGTLLNSGGLDALTGIPTGFFGYALSDPQMMWDAKTQRFYYSVVYYDSLFLSDNGIAIGWSKTATPSSASDFCQYALSFGAELPDYPKLGDSSDFLIYGYNQFSNFAQNYDGSGITVVNKPPAGSSCPPTTAFTATDSGVLHNADGSLAATPVPVNLVDDSNGAGYVVANADLTAVPSANFVSVYTVTTNGTDANGIPVPQISGPANVVVPSYSLPSSAAQNGSSYLLDTLDGRFEAAVAAVDPGHGGAVAIWTAHSVFGGPGAEERWYEIDPNAASVLQSGTAGDPSLFVWNGAVSPDRASTGSAGSHGESMAMSVSTSSLASFPAIQFVWKHAADPQSPLNNLVQSNGAAVDFSCASDTPCRWGDYSGASPDPAAGGGTVGKVWLGNQYALAGGTTASTSWRTWIFGVTPGSTAPPPAPTITSFSPASGPVGTTVTITGTNFTGTASVKFGGTGASFSVASDTSLTATVPTGASTGTIAVTAPGGTATSATAFTVTPPAPTITSFAPTSGPVGVNVTIGGTNFAGTTSVTFGGTSASFTVVSDTALHATVPSGATSGPIAVTTPGGTATSTTAFTVTVPAPTISGFTPTSGPVGTTVTITGTNFTGTTGVTFAGTSASFTVVSGTSLTATVPTGASTGLIAVTTPGGTATSANAFTVTATPPPAPRISSFTPTSGPAGTKVTITGTNFTGTTKVTFGGASATFTVVSSTSLTATVPTAARTGTITVTTAGGTATSSRSFKVTKR